MGKIERIAASYIYTGESAQPLRNSYVEFDSEDGTILSLGQCAENELVVNNTYIFIANNAVYIGEFLGVTQKGGLQFSYELDKGGRVNYVVMPKSIKDVKIVE